ncbi:MAG: CHC2 zinc finger domain-containing protein [Chloroflexota bacterium]|nr:CHC2 zinc finger domain-containing protein [Chloroflexota bacterium]
MKVRMSAGPQQQMQRTYPIQGEVPKTPIASTINVAEVASKIDLVTLAWEYGLDLLPQNNGDYVCLCPFHDDNETPSMRFYVQTNTFHCFGCHAGASVFEFVMRMDNIDFPAALHKLAERAGYTGTYAIRDLNIQSSDDDFMVIREKIEIILHQRAKQVFARLQDIGISLPILYSNFEVLWEWYDRTQYLFDKKLFNGTLPSVLKGTLYRFHEEFLNRLLETEDMCLKM